MRFSKEKGINKVYLIDSEVTSEEVFYNTLKEAIADEYDDVAFNTYLRKSYNDIEIEDYCYDPIEVLEAMRDYDDAYDDWLAAKTQEILEEFNESYTHCVQVYGSDFEIRETRETLVNIQLSMEDVKRLYSALNVNENMDDILPAKAFLTTLEKLIKEELDGGRE